MMPLGGGYSSVTLAFTAVLECKPEQSVLLCNDGVGELLEMQ